MANTVESYNYSIKVIQKLHWSAFRAYAVKSLWYYESIRISMFNNSINYRNDQTCVCRIVINTYEASY